MTTQIHSIIYWSTIVGLPITTKLLTCIATESVKIVAWKAVGIVSKAVIGVVYPTKQQKKSHIKTNEEDEDDEGYILVSVTKHQEEIAK